MTSILLIFFPSVFSTMSSRCDFQCLVFRAQRHVKINFWKISTMHPKMLARAWTCITSFIGTDCSNQMLLQILIGSSYYIWSCMSYPVANLEAFFNHPFWITILIMLLKPPMTIMKRKGNGGSPCLCPLCEGIKPTGSPFTRIENLRVLIHNPIHFNHLSPNAV